MTIMQVASNRIGQSGFSRLKGIFRKGINYTGYEQIVGTAKNKVVGNIPHDMQDLILKRYPQNKAKYIKLVQSAFEGAATVLSCGEKLQIQSINRMRLSLENTSKLIEDVERKDVIYDRLFRDLNAEMLCRAETEIYLKLKTIFPELGNVKLSLIGEGGFSNVYRCQILDKAKQNIVSDTVIKSYKSDSKLPEMVYERLNKMLSKYTDEEIFQYAKNNNINITREKIKSFRTFVPTMAEIASSSNVSKSEQIMHGAKAEANSAQYIRYINGHKITPQDGLLLPDMFYLGENPFSLSKYIDQTQVAKKQFNFERLGLIYLDNYPCNAINGIFVDIGGIKGIPYENMGQILKTNFVGDKKAAKILK